MAEGEAPAQQHQAQAAKPAGDERVFHHAQPSVRARFVQPVVIKHGAVFLLCTDDGDIRPESDQGLYFHDMRYLSGETLRLSGTPLVSLLADAGDGNRGVFALTNPDIQDDDGQLVVRKDTLGISREKRLGDDFCETITIDNYVPQPAAFTLQLSYQADFADMFVIRGAHPGKRGELHAPRWDGDTLTFAYDGADGHQRRAVLQFSQRPDEQHDGDLAYRVSLAGRGRWTLTITTQLCDQGASNPEPRSSGAQDSAIVALQSTRHGASGKGMQVTTSSALFNNILNRSIDDLHMLAMRQKDEAFFAAGVPWYVALFGRDSLVTALQMAAFDPYIGRETLRVHAAHQGTKIDDWRDEQPGKILHELRADEMANLDEIPQTPYYGTVDSTPLFLILMGVYCSWTGDLGLCHELHDNVQRALGWIEQYGDTDGDGFIDYKTRSTKGLRNQGWKDSGNGIVMEDGQLAEPPIALPEVQGVVYLAWSMIAELFEQDGDKQTATELRQRAERLYTAFNQGFWLPDQGYYAFCKQADGRFSKSIASDPAHGLWTGVVAPEHARAVVERVLQPDMFTGWGVRTLSSNDVSYNPVDYQVGSVWPHDNAFIVAGMHRYGFAEQASQVFTAIKEAATHFEHFRLPETFAGYDRGYASKPVRYPVACNPQAWAAGTIPYMLQAALGLQPAAFRRQLHIERPHLPSWLEWVAIERLRVADAEVDLRYERSDGQTLVAVSNKRGDLTVTVRY
ncbi:MAG TPA: glycogen debranching N-terminal domain-containing protein [Chloroflexota bacterium]|nr:glycogen debranching N-terminal domain-containing protein [Chloroflexota bacterium]